MWRHREQTAVDTPRREALILGFQPPGLWDHPFLSSSHSTQNTLRWQLCQANPMTKWQRGGFVDGSEARTSGCRDYSALSEWAHSLVRPAPGCVQRNATGEKKKKRQGDLKHETIGQLCCCGEGGSGLWAKESRAGWVQILRTIVRW